MCFCHAHDGIRGDQESRVLGDVYRRKDFFFQAEDGIRDLVRSRGLGDVYRDRGIKSIGCHDGSVTRVGVRQ